MPATRGAVRRRAASVSAGLATRPFQGGRPTPYAVAVLELVDRIPRGKVMSYGDVAEYVGSGSGRTVGAVMSRHGHEVPWHRVVQSTGGTQPGVSRGGAAAVAPGPHPDARRQGGHAAGPMGREIDMAENVLELHRPGAGGVRPAGARGRPPTSGAARRRARTGRSATWSTTWWPSSCGCRRCWPASGWPTWATGSPPVTCSATTRWRPGTRRRPRPRRRSPSRARWSGSCTCRTRTARARSTPGR